MAEDIDDKITKENEEILKLVNECDQRFDRIETKLNGILEKLKILDEAPWK